MVFINELYKSMSNIFNFTKNIERNKYSHVRLIETVVISSEVYNFKIKTQIFNLQGLLADMSDNKPCIGKKSAS